LTSLTSIPAINSQQSGIERPFLHLIKGIYKKKLQSTSADTILKAESMPSMIKMDVFSHFYSTALGLGVNII
jgi:hypothetical protein